MDLASFQRQTTTAAVEVEERALWIRCRLLGVLAAPGVLGLVMAAGLSFVVPRVKSRQ